MTNLVFKQQYRYDVTTLQPLIWDSILVQCCILCLQDACVLLLVLTLHWDHTEGVKLEFAHLLHQPHDQDSCSDDVGHQMQKIDCSELAPGRACSKIFEHPSCEAVKYSWTMRCTYITKLNAYLVTMRIFWSFL